jgi:nitrite reductase/ring-hydroxylating ferredoxin subunit
MPRVIVPDAASIPLGQGTFIESHGVAFAVFNAGGGRFYACGAVCPHEDGPLSEGWLEGDAVVCPWHGFDFDLATGRCRVDDDLGVPVYPVRAQGDIIEVELP